MAAERWQQISQLYDVARPLGGSERAEFLRKACAGDTALLGEVESLLAHEDAAKSFLKHPPQLEGGDPGLNLIGQQIGPYQITSLLGAGGMGEVYRARDTKLGRDVALKVLPARFTADRDRLARFEREARMLATLNHPHIGAIYGFENAGSMGALVLELVEGPTLADRLARGPIPLTAALNFAREIAEALEAAHEKGLIHRDLKPANIKTTPDGSVKVLDFGLAKAVAGDLAADRSQSPTVTIGTTREGLIVGTAAYMSPEQARGQVVDKRTDIWAFGCVLYEMLTGRAPFQGSTTSDIIVSILEREPDWKVLPANVAPGIRRLLERCLEKDPKRRLRDIGDARLELDDALTLVPRGVESSAQAVVPLWRRFAPAIAASALVLLMTGSGAVFYMWKSSLPLTSAAEYTQLTNFTDSAVAPSLSPDGRMVAFIRGGEGFLSAGQIHVKMLPNGESVRLTSGGGRKYGPVFTPDGSRVAYTDVSSNGWDTWTVPVLGGDATLFLPNASGLTWIADRLVLFAEIKIGFHMGIVTSTENRADSREIYFPAHLNAMAHYAYASPDRQSVLVVEMDQTHAFHQPCRLLPFDGSSAGRQVGPQGTCTAAAWSPDGRWMYFGAVVGGSSHLWRQEFPAGAPEQITFGPTEEEGIALAPDGGSLVTSVGMRRSAIWIHDATGERAISSEGNAVTPRLSLDGKRVFYLLARDWRLSSPGWMAASSELRSVDLASGKTDRLLPGVFVTDYDISRDEKDVAFTTTELGGASQIWLAPLDRRAPPRLIAEGGDLVSFGAGGDLVFRSLDETTNRLARIKKDGTGRALVTTAHILGKGAVSPDGEWVVAQLPRSGEGGSPARGGIYAIPVRGGAPVRICANCRADWSSDGRFFYVASPAAASTSSPGKTLAIPVPPGKSLPDLPASGIDIDMAGSGSGVEGASIIDHSAVSGPNPSLYVFSKTDLQRNLFRVPLH